MKSFPHFSLHYFPACFPGGMHLCAFCLNMFPSRFSDQMHPCASCLNMFPSRFSARMHLYTSHLNTFRSHVPGRTYLCIYCLSIFPASPILALPVSTRSRQAPSLQNPSLYFPSQHVPGRTHLCIYCLSISSHTSPTECISILSTSIISASAFLMESS